MTDPLENEQAQPQVTDNETTQPMRVELSEEQLHAITGGCSECDHFQSVVDFHKDHYDKSVWLAEGNNARGDREEAKRLARDIAYYGRMEKLWQRKLDTSRATHGYPSVSGESSSSLPDLTRLRLQ